MVRREVDLVQVKVSRPRGKKKKKKKKKRKKGGAQVTPESFRFPLVPLPFTVSSKPGHNTRTTTKVAWELYLKKKERKNNNL